MSSGEEAAVFGYGYKDGGKGCGKAEALKKEDKGCSYKGEHPDFGYDGADYRLLLLSEQS